MQTDLRETMARGATGRPAAADADPAARPGVPMYKPAGTSAPIVRPPLDHQEAQVPILIGVEVDHLTPVFGTAQPPRGLSGVLRRAAYGIPEHKAGRWMMLLAADRVDVWESRAVRNPWLTGLLAATAVGAAALLWSHHSHPTRRRS
jgi:hypothetical protein